MCPFGIVDILASIPTSEENGMNDDEFARKAAALGLSKLATQHEADLRKALENGKALAEKLPTDLHWSEEPFHTFSLATRTEVKA